MKILVPPNKKNTSYKPFSEMEINKRAEFVEKIFREFDKNCAEIEYTEKELRKIRGREL